MYYVHYYSSPLGKITLSSDGTSITGLWFSGQKRYAAGLAKERTEKHLPIFIQAEKWLEIYFSGHNPCFVPSLKMKGTPFQKTVWQMLLGVPYGKTLSYGKIAETIAKQKGIAKMSAQAVGAAVAHNPVALIIPCHRVIGSDGSLTGYAAGIHRKIMLLKMEKAFFNPLA